MNAQAQATQDLFKFQAANGQTLVIETGYWNDCSSPLKSTHSLWEKFGKRRVYIDIVYQATGKCVEKLGYICLDTNKPVFTTSGVKNTRLWKEFLMDANFVSEPVRPKAICRRAVMVRAHEIARSLQGDRAACLSFALKQAWAEAKA